MTKYFVKYNEETSEIIKVVQYTGNFPVAAGIVIIESELILSQLRQSPCKWMVRPGVADLIDPVTKTMVGKLIQTPITEEQPVLHPETGESLLDEQGNPVVETVIVGYEYQINPDVNELDLFELNPDWPPVGYQEDPENPGLLIPTESYERDRLEAGLISLASVADVAMGEINDRFEKLFTDLDKKYPLAEREDWPYLTADAKIILSRSDEDLNTEESREEISSIALEVLGEGFDLAIELTEEEIGLIRSRAEEIVANATEFRRMVALAKNVKYTAKATIDGALSMEDPGEGYDAIRAARDIAWESVT